MNILITGTSRGIGYELVKQFVRMPGVTVYAMSRNKLKYNNLDEIAPQSKVVPLQQQLNAEVLESSGSDLLNQIDGHLDVLIHNAGNLINKPFESLGASEWHAMYETNVLGPALLTRVLLERMGGTSHTHVVMLGSMGGVTGSSKFRGLSAYSSSKGALSVLAECLAVEFAGRNISANCLALGSVNTEMLAAAFPGYAAPVGPAEIGAFISDFALNGWKVCNGVTVPVRLSNP